MLRTSSMCQHVLAQDIDTPAPMFTRIQIQTVSWCNRSCAFCPSGKFPLPKALMALPIYHRLLDQLQELEFAGRISPYLMNEPLLDKRLPELIADTRRRCPASWIAINTNGDALSEAMANRLFDAGLNCMDVNAYDHEAQYTAYVKLAEGIAARRGDITFSTGYLDPTFNRTDLPRQTKILHCRDMTDWERRFRAKLDLPDLTNRSGNVPGTHSPTAPLPLGCERPFQQMYINYHGKAVLCCNDWRHEVVMGDAVQSTLLEIWNNNKYQTYRDHLNRCCRAMPLCATCDYRGNSAV